VTNFATAAGSIAAYVRSAQPIALRMKKSLSSARARQYLNKRFASVRSF